MEKGKCCNIEFAENSSGKKLADEFLEGLDDRVAVKFRAIFAELLDSERGYIQNTQKMEKLTGGSGIWELKAKAKGIGNFRIFCFKEGPTWFLTHGFPKKKERTRRGEIKRAVDVKSRYCE